MTARRRESADEADEADEATRTTTSDDGHGDDLLVREGDVAGDYLERLLDILDVDGDIDLDVEGDRASVAIVGGRLTDLIGPDGATLEALQELTRLAVAQSTGVRSRLMLDIGGFRAKRRADLTALGRRDRRAGSPQSRQPERLAPMNPFERKVVHDVIAVGRRRAQRVRGRGAEPPRRGPARQVTGPSASPVPATGRLPPAEVAASRSSATPCRWPSAYVARLASDGVVRGLIGPREVPRLWERHVLNSAAVAEAVPPGARVVDVGSGAGLPGHPARAGPAGHHAHAGRADGPAGGVPRGGRRRRSPSRPARSAWRVVRGRAEERAVVAAVGPVDVVTARAVAPLPRLVGWCRGLMRPGTQLVALVGARALDGAARHAGRARGRRHARRAFAGCRCGARRRCHYRGGHDAWSTVTALASSSVRPCSTWNRYSTPDPFHVERPNTMCAAGRTRDDRPGRAAAQQPRRRPVGRLVVRRDG